MLQTILLIIMASGIGIYHNSNKPTEYELNMEDGSNTHVVLQKNSSYACPLYCIVDHIHHAVMYQEDEYQIKDHQFVYHITEKNENGISIFCSTKKILSMSRLTPKTAQDKLPDIVSANKEK